MVNTNTNVERIPDFYKAGSVVGDVKDVKVQNLSEQMTDNGLIALGSRFNYAGTNKKVPPANRLDLIVRIPSDRYPEGTHVSAPLKSFIAENGGTIFELIE